MTLVNLFSEEDILIFIKKILSVYIPRGKRVYSRKL